MSEGVARTAAGRLASLAVALGTGLLAAGYLLEGPEPWAAFAASAPAMLWIAARRRRWAPAVDASLAAFMALAGIGLWLRVGAGWMMPAAAAGLGAWDLAHLDWRLADAGHVEGRDLLESRHLAHLLPVLVLGLAFALVGAGVRLRLGFFPALLLGVLAIAGLARAILFLRRDDE